MRETKLECQVKTQTAASLLRAIKSHHQKNLVLSQRNGKNGSADSKDFEKPQPWTKKTRKVRLAH